MFCVPTVVNVVGSVAVANALPIRFVDVVGTTVTVQELAVPQAEKVIEPVGPAPLLPVPVTGLCVKTVAVNVTD
jgi:hypothetical protein